MLLCAGELIEKSRLAAVLVSDERERQNRPLGKRIAASLRVESAALAEPEVLSRGLSRLFLLLCDAFRRVDFYIGRVVKTQGQLISRKC